MKVDSKFFFLNTITKRDSTQHCKKQGNWKQEQRDSKLRKKNIHTNTNLMRMERVGAEGKVSWQTLQCGVSACNQVQAVRDNLAVQREARKTCQQHGWWFDYEKNIG